MERSLYKRALQLGVLLLYLRVGGGANQLGMFACRSVHDTLNG